MLTPSRLMQTESLAVTLERGWKRVCRRKPTMLSISAGQSLMVLDKRPKQIFVPETARVMRLHISMASLQMVI